MKIFGILVASIFFINKVCLILNIRLGWWIGALASLLSIFYFIATDRYAYTALEFGLIAIMLYGLLKEKNDAVEQIILGLTVLSMLAILTLSSFGQLTTLEVLSSLLTLLGSYRMVSRKNYGWALCGLGHILCGYVMEQIGQDFFSHLQYASAILAVINSIYLLTSQKHNHGLETHN